MQKLCIRSTVTMFNSRLCDREETYSGLRFIYYREETLKELIPDGLEVLVSRKYTEMEDNDSFSSFSKRDEVK